MRDGSRRETLRRSERTLALPTPPLPVMRTSSSVRRLHRILEGLGRKALKGDIRDRQNLKQAWIMQVSSSLCLIRPALSQTFTFGHQHPSRELSRYRAVTCTGNEQGQENRHYYTTLSRRNLTFTLVSAIQHVRINSTFYSSDFSSCRMCASGKPLWINPLSFMASPRRSQGLSWILPFPARPFTQCLLAVRISFEWVSTRRVEGIASACILNTQRRHLRSQF